MATADVAIILPLASPVREQPAAVAVADTRGSTVVADGSGERDLLSDQDVRRAVDLFVRDLRTRAASNFDLQSFYHDGDEHRVAVRVVTAPIDAPIASVRTSIELTIAKFDAVGRRETRVLPVAMTVAKRNGAVSISAVAFGVLRKP